MDGGGRAGNFSVPAADESGTPPQASHRPSLASAKMVSGNGKTPSVALHFVRQAARSAPKKRGKAHNLRSSHLRTSTNSPFFALTRDFSLSTVFKLLNTQSIFGLAKKPLSP